MLAPQAEKLPTPPGVAPAEIHRTIPLAGTDAAGQIDFKYQNGNGLVSLVVRDAPLGAVLNALAQQQGINLAMGEDIKDQISVTLSDISFDEALSAVVALGGCTWNRQGNIVFVTRVGMEAKGGPQLQGRQVRVFPLNYISAMDVDLVIKGLLSPVGQSFINQTMSTDDRKTRELIVVEDLPGSMARIADCIAQLDQPPRQVLIEAHILQVDLKKDCQHGVNFNRLAKIAGVTINPYTTGFANPAATPSFFFNMTGPDMTNLLACLTSTTNAKSLASPKILALNGQEAMIQIGSRLGYRVTTATVTTSMQSVNFLETGVVLRVTPRITADNQVLMFVKPKVSTGSVDQVSGLPSEQTTEAGTATLLADGRGMLLGGLIKENDSNIQSKVPFLGDIWLLGLLFQRRAVVHERSEIIIALIPRIVPYAPEYEACAQALATQAATPLYQGALQPIPRPWEPDLYDAVKNPAPILPGFH